MSKEVKRESNKYKGLSAILLMVFAQNTKHDRKYSATGYELSKLLKHMSLYFSHQQIYREIKKIDLLQVILIPQDGKPDKKVYSLIDGTPEGISLIESRIDVNPKSTNPKYFLAFNFLSLTEKAFLAYAEFFKQEKRAVELLQSKFSGSASEKAIGENLRDFEFVSKKALLDVLASHLEKIACEEMGRKAAYKYLFSVFNVSSV